MRSRDYSQDVVAQSRRPKPPPPVVPADRGLVVIDNLLMSGEVGLPEGSDTFWSEENLTATRTLNAEILGTGWLGVVLSVGDGVGLAVRS